MLLQSWLANWRRNAGRLMGPFQNRRRVRPVSAVPASSEILESRCLLTATIDLANLGLGGVTLYGVDLSGRAVSGIGDINGDGYDDVLIGALNAGGAGNATPGAGDGYVVFGKADWSATPTLELSTLNGTNGFVLYGTDATDFTGAVVREGGDLNGDGFDDLLIAAYRADGVGNAKASSGETYVVFGKSTWTASLSLSALNGTNGVTLLGTDASDQSGRAISAAGDVNGDGFDDIVIGAPGADGVGTTKQDIGKAYVVFGKSDWSATPTVNLGSLNGTTGFIVSGVDLDDGIGRAVAGAGDVNGDGYADILIGAPFTDGFGNAKAFAGESYVVFGKANWAGTPTLTVSSLNGTNGVTLYGIDADDSSGISVDGAGDVNGDGFDDIIIGASAADGINNVLESDAGESYIVFGKSSWTATPTIQLNSLTGTNGFVVYGVSPIYEEEFTIHSQSGTTVSGIGDLNGDGYDDVLISAAFATGQDSSTNNLSGQSYVVYGKPDWSLSPTLIVTALDGTNGFTVFGVDFNDQSGYWASGAGDFNGDGFADLLIGAPNGDGAGNLKGNAGDSYVVFGGNFTDSATQVGTAIGQTLTGTAAVDKLVGGGGNDTLLGGGGGDVLYGGQGDDTLNVSGTNFARVDGGNGTDTLKLTGSGLNLDLTALANGKLTNIELIDIRGSGGNTLTLNALEVLNLTQASNPGHTANTLRVRRDGNDTVTMGTGWIAAANEVVGGLTYQVFTLGQARLLLEVVGQTPPGVSLNIDHATIAENLGTATVTATLLDPADGQVTINLSFTGSAAFPGDYSRSDIQIVIPSGQSTGSITLTAVSDGDVEVPETINVAITSVTGGLDFSSTAVSTQIIDDDNHAPVFDSDATPEVVENTTAVVTVVALDTDTPTQTVTYSITGGVDKDLFSITSSGILTFKAAPDFETPQDVGANNTYEVQVTANDGFGATSTQNLTVTVTDVDDVPTIDLDLGEPQTITWIKKDAPVTVLPAIVVSASGNLVGSTLTISMVAPGSTKKAADMLTVLGSSIGSTTGQSYLNGKLTQVITLNQNATAASIQSLLRSIKFSTKGKGLNTPTRRLDVTIAVNGGSTETVSQTITVVKKVPRAPRNRG